MPGIPFRVEGKLFAHDERTALLLSRCDRHFTLRLGFVLQGSEEIMLPETLLDDWGHEIGGSELYQWVRENAPHFPRAELFGFDSKGRAQQCFVRDLDLAAKYICQISEHPDEALEKGNRLAAIVVPDDGPGRHRQKKAPANISFPLRDADVEWWLVDRTLAQQDDYDFYGAQYGGGIE